MASERLPQDHTEGPINPSSVDLVRIRQDRLTTVFPQVLDRIVQMSPWYKDDTTLGIKPPNGDAREAVRRTVEGAQGWECSPGVVANLTTTKIIDGKVVGLLLGSYNEATGEVTLQENDTAGSLVTAITFKPGESFDPITGNSHNMYNHLTYIAPNDRGEVVAHRFHGPAIWPAEWTP